MHSWFRSRCELLALISLNAISVALSTGAGYLADGLINSLDWRKCIVDSTIFESFYGSFGAYMLNPPRKANLNCASVAWVGRKSVTFLRHKKCIGMSKTNRTRLSLARCCRSTSLQNGMFYGILAPLSWRLSEVHVTSQIRRWVRRNVRDLNLFFGENATQYCGKLLRMPTVYQWNLSGQVENNFSCVKQNF